MFITLNEKSIGLRLLGLLACAVLQATAVHAATIPLNNSVAGAIAYDEGANCLYFLAGNVLMRLPLTPGCEAGTTACPASTLVVSLPSTPVDVAVNSAAGLAYVTSRVGGLWKVDLKTPAPVAMSIAPGLGATHIVLAPEINAAFFLDTSGMLKRVDLSTGTPPTPTTLAQVTRAHQALAVNAARTFAYVSSDLGENLPRGTIREIDLATGKQTRAFGNFGFFDSATSLAWADSSERALYALINGGESGSGSYIVRVDLMTAQVSSVAQFTGHSGPLSSIPVSALAANPSGTGLYLGEYNQVSRFPFSVEPDDKHVFISIGNIPVKDISSSGYADTSTDPAGLFRVVNSPFGGTLDIFGNFPLLIEHGAHSYQIMIQSVGPGPIPFPVPLLASWTAHQWNPNPPLAHFEPMLVAPVAGIYNIPLGYGTPYWDPPNLMMRWQTSDNGLYRLTLKVFSDASGTREITIPAAQQPLTVLIDNTPPVVAFKSIRAGGVAIQPCQIVSAGDLASRVYTFDLTAYDPNAHLLNYTLSALWGRNQSATLFSGPFDLDDNDFRPDSAPSSDGWQPTCNCAHTFTLHVTKRTIDGKNYILSASSYQSITIDNAPNSCP